MMKKLTIALLLGVCALPAAAQNWSFGARTGAFVFGDFLERRLQPIAGDDADATTLSLSAETAPGVAFDLERSFADRWAVRFEGTFTRSPLALRDSSNEEADIRSGDLDVTTFTLPIVFRINTGGAFRFHLFGGPAYAMYRFEPPDEPGSLGAPDDTRSEWGWQAGAGVAWMMSDRFGIEGQISDVSTGSPIERSDLPNLPGFDIPRPHNIHTTVGIRYRF